MYNRRPLDQQAAEAQKWNLFLLMFRSVPACLTCRSARRYADAALEIECAVWSGQALDICATSDDVWHRTSLDARRTAANKTSVFRQEVERDWTCRWPRFTFLGSALRPCFMRRLNSCHLNGSWTMHPQQRSRRPLEARLASCLEIPRVQPGQHALYNSSGATARADALWDRKRQLKNATKPQHTGRHRLHKRSMLGTARPYTDDTAV